MLRISSAVIGFAATYGVLYDTYGLSWGGGREREREREREKERGKNRCQSITHS